MRNETNASSPIIRALSTLLVLSMNKSLSKYHYGCKINPAWQSGGKAFSREQEAELRVDLSYKPFFQLGDVTIYNSDILKLKAISPNSIDLIVTSPPYSVDIKYGNYDDGIPYPDYLKFTEAWLTRCLDFSKSDGRLCLNVPLDKNKGGQQSICADLTTAAKKVGWKYQSTIIWNEQNISRRTAWGSWLSASAPFVIAPVEVIVVMYKQK